MAAFLSDTWSSVKSTTSSLKNNVFGPDYSYIDHIPKPESKGVGDAGNFGQVSTNVFAGFDYVNVIGRTKKQDALGNSFLVKTGGMCVTPTGELKERMNYVNNIPTGKGVTGTLLGYGLASGIVEDVFSLNPAPLMRAVSADPTPACRKYKCEVTDTLNGDTGYITPSLNPGFDADKCKRVDEALPANWVDSDNAEIARLQKEVDETKQLLAKDKGNPDLRSRLYDSGGLADQLQAAVDAKESRQERLDKFKKIKEDFGMNSTAFGGVLMAGVLLAVLVFSKRG